ncbi:Transient receptor potential cation channel subfamily M member 8 [Clarias magur]|uniref:Transient receptor potential cation channel subfamily M member 8 n=1 Tax=Clarias magur TaxID=1594786 RepID=A0A8J4TPZ3_CLAMG|nr:Transient receptor potential cation channel subfamily M member 8 [Clarias magur]
MLDEARFSDSLPARSCQRESHFAASLCGDVGARIELYLLDVRIYGGNPHRRSGQLDSSLQPARDEF